MLLINVSEFHGLAHLECSSVGFLQPHDKTEECGLSCSVRTNDTHDAVRWQHEVEIVEQHFAAESLLYVLSLDDLVAQTRSVRNEDLEFLLALFLLLVEHLLIGVKTSLAFSLSGFWCHTYPFELSLKGFPSLRSRLLFLLHSLGLLVEP